MFARSRQKLRDQAASWLLLLSAPGLSGSSARLSFPCQGPVSARLDLLRVSGAELSQTFRPQLHRSAASLHF